MLFKELILETRCVRIKLKPDSLEKVRAWATEANTRKAEALDILKREGVTIESAFLDEVVGEHYLVYYMKAENLDKSQQIAAESAASLDAYHKQFKKDCWESVTVLEQLIDFDLSSH